MQTNTKPKQQKNATFRGVQNKWSYKQNPHTIEISYNRIKTDTVIPLPFVQLAAIIVNPIVYHLQALVVLRRKISLVLPNI